MKLNKLKLNEISKNNLTQKEMKMVKGGDPVVGRSCSCSCYWEGNTGSSTEDNCQANYAIGSKGGYSKDGDNKACDITDFYY